jgi:hypothetical protein
MDSLLLLLTNLVTFMGQGYFGGNDPHMFVINTFSANNEIAKYDKIEYEHRDFFENLDMQFFL